MPGSDAVNYMPNESKLVWSPLKTALDRAASLAIGTWDYQRIESRVGLGIPDTNIYVPSQGDHWIELKYAVFPHLDGRTLKVGLEPAQYIWMRRAARAGRKILLLARVSPTPASERLKEFPWRAWENEKDWELAKHPAPTCVMEANSQGFRSPESFLLWLAGGRGGRS